MSVNPYKKYQEQSISTMTQGELLNILYETCSKRLNSAVANIQEKKYDIANENIKKAKSILRYLDTTLDMTYDISDNLSSLYNFFIKTLTTANMKKDSAIILEIIPMIDDLGKTFKEAEKIARKKRAWFTYFITYICFTVFRFLQNGLRQDAFFVHLVFYFNIFLGKIKKKIKFCPLLLTKVNKNIIILITNCFMRGWLNDRK